MPKVLSDADVAAYRRDGYRFPVDALSIGEATDLRTRLERFEASTGRPIAGNLRHKTHLVFTWLNQLVRHPKILDAVEDVLGPDILCWSSTFFIKEPRDAGFVSWHQDATYWGLSTPDVVTAWVALSPASPETGPMRVVPGTHLAQVGHRDTWNPDNLLSRGQEVEVSVDPARAVDMPLRTGQMSLHHVLIVHGSEPNRSDDRRIGFAIRYIPPHVHQKVQGVRDCATLVRGVDRFGHFDHEIAPDSDLSERAMAAHRDAAERSAKILYAGTKTGSYDKVERG